VKEAVATGLDAALALEDREKVDEILAIVRSEPIGRRAMFYRAHAARVEARSPGRTYEEIERLFTSAIGGFREIGSPFRMAVALLEYGEWLDSRGGAADAAPHVAEARSIFEGLGAQPWFQRADRVPEGTSVRS
jgi:hypothetical protein